MSQNFTVNGKEYLQSNVLASTFGYSADYLSKLARDEKILGTQIGRQWFIEPESLKTFLAKSAVEKELRKSELSAKRKIEHALHTKAQVVTQVPVISTGSSALAFAQAMVVVLCGLFAGGLGFVVINENLGVGEIAQGAGESLALVRESILPFASEESARSFPSAQLAASSEGVIPRVVTRFESSLSFTVLPEFPERGGWQLASSSVSTSTETGPDLNTLAFSDEVRVVFDENGNQFIEPVFKQTSSTSARFMLVPANDLEN